MTDDKNYFDLIEMENGGSCNAAKAFSNHAAPARSPTRPPTAL